MTSSNGEWGGGLAYVEGACVVDTNQGYDFGTAVWDDHGAFDSVTVAAHEIGHTLATISVMIWSLFYVNIFLFFYSVGAQHDDYPEVNCPGPYGFIMSGGDENSRYFFQKCSNDAISSYVK